MTSTTCSLIFWAKVRQSRDSGISSSRTIGIRAKKLAAPRYTLEIGLALRPGAAPGIPLDAADAGFGCSSRGGALRHHAPGATERKAALPLDVALRRLDGALGAADLYAARGVVFEAG